MCVCVCVCVCVRARAGTHCGISLPSKTPALLFYQASYKSENCQPPLPPHLL